MESGVSNQAFQQQQQQNNLQHLHQLEVNYNNYQQSRSFTSTDNRRLVSDSPANELVGPQHADSFGSVNRGQFHQQLQQQQQPPTASRNISTQQPATNIDPRSPFSVSVPTNANPTEVLSARFSSWRSITTWLLQYLNEIVSIQDEVVRQQVRLSHAVNFPQFTQGTNKRASTTGVPAHTEDVFQGNFFLGPGNGSIQDLPNILINFHATSANLASKTSKELRTVLIPRLEDLKRELLVKIREIKSLSSDFKNSVSKEVGQTKLDLQSFYKSIEDAKYHHTSIQPKNDPYLTKIILDRQIKKQLLEENYLHEAYINLQSSGKELEKVVVVEIQNALTVFAKLLGEQAQNVFDKLISNLDYGFLTKQPTFEWDQFIAKDKNFIDENLPKRDYKTIQYEKMNDNFSLEIRASFLERRSKFLKSYSRGYYVLTSTFFHEFKSADRKRDLIPVMSLPLDDIELEDYSKKDSNQNKFVLKKVGKLSSHKFIFRADNYELMLSWYNDIKNLKKLSSPLERSNYASKNHTKRAANDELSRMTSRNSKVVRAQSINDSTHETDTILGLPLTNQTLPQQSSSPIPQSILNGVYVKQVDVSPQLAQQQNFGEQEPHQQQQQPQLQQQPQQHQQYQQYPPQQYSPQQYQQYPSQSAPPPQQQQSQQPLQQQQNQQYPPYPATPLQRSLRSNGINDQGLQLRRSLESQRSGGLNGAVVVNSYGGDGTLVSDDTTKSAKKETHTDDSQID